MEFKLTKNRLASKPEHFTNESFDDKLAETQGWERRREERESDRGEKSARRWFIKCS
jgi:hypothetical protein